VSCAGNWAAFTSLRDGNAEIYVMHIGTNRQVGRLTNDPGQDSRPAWSPDGTKMAFASNRDGDFDIYVLDVAKGRIVQLTKNDHLHDDYPAWSPDGTKIAYSAEPVGTPPFVSTMAGDIAVMDSAGNHLYSLWANSLNNDFDPVWVENGRFIAFVSDRDVPGVNIPRNNNIWLADASNPSSPPGYLEPLTNDPAQDLNPYYYCSSGVNPNAPTPWVFVTPTPVTPTTLIPTPTPAPTPTPFVGTVTPTPSYGHVAPTAGTTIFIDQQSSQAGSQVTIVIEGLHPNTTAYLWYDANHLATSVTLSNGEIKFTFQVPVTAGPGKHVVEVIDGYGARALIAHIVP